jgi:hypothetical protein
LAAGGWFQVVNQTGAVHELAVALRGAATLAAAAGEVVTGCKNVDTPGHVCAGRLRQRYETICRKWSAAGYGPGSASAKGLDDCRIAFEYQELGMIKHDDGDLPGHRWLTRNDTYFGPAQ